MATINSGYLESSVESPSKFGEMLEELDSDPELEMDIWYEDINAGERVSEPDLEFVLQKLGKIQDSWWQVGDSEVFETTESYHVEFPIYSENIRNGSYSGQPENYLLGATVYEEPDEEFETPESCLEKNTA